MVSFVLYGMRKGSERRADLKGLGSVSVLPILALIRMTADILIRGSKVFNQEHTKSVDPASIPNCASGSSTSSESSLALFPYLSRVIIGMAEEPCSHRKWQ